MPDFTGDQTAVGPITNDSGQFTRFYERSSAGAAEITSNSGGYVSFDNMSKAGTATLINSGGATYFYAQSRAGDATISNSGSGGTVFFGGSTAETAAITNGSGGVTAFEGASTAGDADIVNNSGGGTAFRNASTAGTAAIITNSGGATTFQGTSSAGTAAATITTTTGGSVGFYEASKAGSAAIATDGGKTYFYGTSTAESAVLTTTNRGALYFEVTSRAGSATLINSGGTANFYDRSTAENADITNSAEGGAAFYGTSRAGDAAITNNNGGATVFYEDSSADTAEITNNSGGLTFFRATSTAGSAEITTNDGGTTAFFDRSQAGSATLTTGSGGFTYFLHFSTAGGAQLVAELGGVVDFSSTIGLNEDRKISAGSIEGAGTFRLGSNQLTIGGSGASTIVDGRIQDGGDYGGTRASLLKTGAGTLTLSGVNTYTGGTILQAGTLALVSAQAAGTGAITFTSGAQTLRLDPGALGPSGGTYANTLADLGHGDVLDLRGLVYTSGATATYDGSHLTVTSGAAQERFTVTGSYGGLTFQVASDSAGSVAVRVVDITPPTTTIDAIDISDDTGASQSDFITNVAAQTVTATLSAALAADERLYASADDGAHWVDISSSVTVTGVTWSGVTLAGTSSLRFKVTDAAGNDGVVAVRSYTLDTSTPSAPAGLDLAAADDTGSSDADNLTRATAALTISGTGETGAQVTLFDDLDGDGAVDVGETLATMTVAEGTFSAEVSLDAGSHSLKAVQTDLAGNVSTLSPALAVTVDTASPTVTVSMTQGAFSDGDRTETVTFTFSEVPTGFDRSDVTVAGGSIGDVTQDLTADPNGTIYTATFTATDDSVTPVSIQVGAGKVTDPVGNASTASNEVAATVDTRNPTVAVAIEDAALSDSDPSSVVTFTFSEAVDPATVAATADGGTLSSLTWASDGLSATATFTASDGFSGTGSVAVTGFRDLAGNDADLATGASDTVVIDRMNPTVTVALDQTSFSDSDNTATVTFTFSAVPTGFEESDIAITGGALSGLAQDLVGDPSGKTYTATVAAADDATAPISVAVAAQTFTNASGNENTASNAATATVDTRNPTATVAMAQSRFTAGQSATVTFTFTEAPVGFTLEDVTAENGTMSGLAATPDPGVFTATFTAAGEVLDATNLITLGTGWSDAVGNAPGAEAVSANYALDTRAAAVPSGPDLDPLSDTGTSSSDDITGDSTPTFTGSGVHPGSLVRLYADAVLVGTGLADAAGLWSITASELAAGTYSITARQVDAAGVEGPASAGLSVTISPRVDGMVVESTTETSRTGQITAVTTIPVVTDARVEQDRTTPSADIPLVTVAGELVLTVAVPVGFGLRVESIVGVSSADGLIQAIRNHTESGPQQQIFIQAATAFLASLDAAVNLTVRTMVPVVPGDTAPGLPLLIRGSDDTSGGQEALVIDASHLPAGTAIQLENVEFVVVIGAVTITGGSGAQVVFADGAAQRIVLGADDDELHGGGGDDVIGSHGGNDRLFGDGGDDAVTGGDGNDRLFGGEGDDTVTGGEGDDHLFGDEGDDLLAGGEGDDELWGGAGHDRLKGEGGGDVLSGDEGRDRLWGAEGRDHLIGGAGHDSLWGGVGDDRLEGGTGRDRLVGGEGADTFVFGRIEDDAAGRTHDAILDLVSGEDRISLRGIDADEGRGGNQHFGWAHEDQLNAAFTGEAGELRFARGMLMGDVDGDGHADFRIKVQGTLVSEDVIL